METTTHAAAPATPYEMVRLALASVEQLRKVQPLSTTSMFQRACLLEQSGRAAEASAQYLELLEQEPNHARALNNLGSLLMAAHQRTEARRIFTLAVERNPTHLDSRANLGNLLVKESELTSAREQFEAALAIDPGYRPGHAGLSFILGELGEPERAAVHRAKAFAGHAVVIAPYRGDHPPITVLELVSTTGGNIRTDEFLSDRVFQRIIVTTEFYTPSTVLPPHDLVLNAIGDADLAAVALAGALEVIERTGAPILNSPAAVLATGRCAIAERLATIHGVKTALTICMKREELLAPNVKKLLRGHGFEFPLLLRSPGFHGGDHFLKVERGAHLAKAVRALPGDELMVMEYLDARSKDGLSRKYRVMIVDGRLYPLHCAISANWKIHYFSADMADSVEHRAEDARFLADMPGVLGPVALAALEAIARTLGLDYGGIDFGLNRAGEVLIFEANATMAVVIPDKDPRWDYRRGPIETIYKAVWAMLGERAGVRRSGSDVPASA